jgi:hypothetical protein
VKLGITPGCSCCATKPGGVCILDRAEVDAEVEGRDWETAGSVSAAYVLYGLPSVLSVIVESRVANGEYTDADVDAVVAEGLLGCLVVEKGCEVQSYMVEMALIGSDMESGTHDMGGLSG